MLMLYHEKRKENVCIKENMYIDVLVGILPMKNLIFLQVCKRVSNFGSYIHVTFKLG